jgi:hypothetical protein
LPGSISHDEHRQPAHDDLTRWHGVAEGDHLAGRNARVANASSAHLLGRQDALRVLDDGQPACFKLTPSGTVGVLRDALPDPLEVGFQFDLADGLLGHIALPAKAALVARAVQASAVKHSKVAEVPWQTGTEG